MRVTDISSEVRAEIDDFLLAHNFSRYRELARLLRTRHGVRIGKSTLHEWGKAFRKEYQAAQRLAVRARAIAAGIGEGTPMSTKALERLAAELTEAAEAQRKKRTENRRRERRVKLA
jgi:hypothetical protein